MGDDSRDLVESASRGDEPAIEALLGRFLPGLERYVRRRAGAVVLGHESSSDVVQSVCRELLVNLRRERFEYRGEAEFKQWLYTAALQKLEGRRRHWRAEKREAAREVAPDGFDPPASATPSADAVRREQFDALRSSLTSLPANYREILTLAYIDGLAHAEIAARLAISETNSRVLLSRALARLATVARRELG